MRVSVGAREPQLLMGCVVVAGRIRNEMVETVAVEPDRVAGRGILDCSSWRLDFGMNYRERCMKTGSDAAQAMHPEECPRCT